MFYCDVFGGRVYSGCFTVMCLVVEYIVGVLL